MKEKNKTTLPLSTIAAYGIGYLFAGNFYQCFLSFTLLFFMTNVLEIPTIAAAAAYSATQFINLISMFMGGVIIDSTNLKFGKYRPWVFIGTLLVIVSAGSMFLNLGLSSSKAVLFIIVMYAIQSFGYNTAWSANRSLVGPMSKNTSDSMALVTSANFGAAAAPIIYGIISVPFLAVFAFAGKQQYGFTMYAYTMILLLGSILMLAITKKFDLPNTEENKSEKTKSNRISFGEMLRSLKGQSIIFFVAILIGNIQNGFFTALLAYFTIYVLKNPAAMGIAVTLQSVGKFVGTALGPILSKKFSKKTMYIGCNLIDALLYILMFLVGRTAVPFLIIRTIIGIVASLNGILLPAMSIDVADYNEMKGESRARAFVQSLMGTTLRIGGLISASVASFGLAATGFVAGSEPTAEIINKIIVLMGIGPAAVCALASLVMFFYKISEEELNEYRAQRSLKLQEENEPAK